MAKTAHLILLSRYLNLFKLYSTRKFYPPGSTQSLPGGFYYFGAPKYYFTGSTTVNERKF